MRKVLLALFVLVMLGYSAITVYFVFGFGTSTEVTVSEEEQILSSEEELIAAAYANIVFEGMNEEYCDDSGMVNTVFCEKIADVMRNETMLKALIARLELEYTAESVSERILVEPHADKKNAVVLRVLDEDQYTAADLCNGVMDILYAAEHMEGLYAGFEVLDVGTEDYTG